jgi:hypothetical protein
MTPDYSLRVLAHSLRVFTSFSPLFRVLPHGAGVTSLFRSVPLRAHFTPSTALIFINNINEKIGEK